MPDKKPFHVAGLEPMKMKVLGVNIFPLVAKVAVMMMMLVMIMMTTGTRLAYKIKSNGCHCHQG